MKFFLIGWLIAAAIFVPATYGQTADALHTYDPLKRNLIFVEGEAETTVPINGFSLTFSFDVDKASFEEASRDSDRIVDGITSGLKGLGFAKVEPIKGWDLVKQVKISFGAKGRKISNRLVVKVHDFPAGKLHESIARSIDKSISVDGSVALENVEVFVSEEVENQKKQEVQTAALKVLDANAVRAAGALGREKVTPKNVFVIREEVFRQAQMDSYLSENYSAQSSLKRESFVSVQKSFKVKAEIVDHLKIAVRVSGVYEIE